MLCEVLLSSLWFLFVIFWVETISVWLFLSMFYQDRAFYHWGDGITNDRLSEARLPRPQIYGFVFPINISVPTYLKEEGEKSRVFADDPGAMIYMLSRGDTHIQTEMHT